MKMTRLNHCKSLNLFFYISVMTVSNPHYPHASSTLQKTPQMSRAAHQIEDLLFMSNTLSLMIKRDAGINCVLNKDSYRKKKLYKEDGRYLLWKLRAAKIILVFCFTKSEILLYQCQWLTLLFQGSDENYSTKITGKSLTSVRQSHDSSIPSPSTVKIGPS